METIRLIVEKVTLGDETASRVWSPDCSGLGIIAQTDEEALILANRAVAEFRKSRGQHMPYETTALRSKYDPSSGRVPGSQPFHR
jgi:hypothetical protein